MGNLEYRPRERILVGGPSGAGKTYSFLKLVEHLSNGHHLAIEVDDGFTRLLALEFAHIPATIYEWGDGRWQARPDFSSGDTLVVYHCRTFDQVTAAQAELEKLVTSKKIGKDDWVCVDGLDLIYNNMRYEYQLKAGPALRAGQNSGKSAWELVQSRRATGAPILEPADWDVIHSFYESFLTYLAFQIPCNLFCTTNIEVIDIEGRYTDSETKALAKALGVNVRFEGQKRTPRLFDTLLGFKHDISGYYVYIWKDRGGQGRPWRQGKINPQMAYSNEDFFLLAQKLFGLGAKESVQANSSY